MQECLSAGVPHLVLLYLAGLFRHVAPPEKGAGGNRKGAGGNKKRKRPDGEEEAAAGGEVPTTAGEEHAGVLSNGAAPQPVGSHPVADTNTSATSTADGGAEQLRLGDLSVLRRAGKGGVDPDGEGNTIVASDVLWSDPVMEPGLKPNEARGVGLVFGPDMTQVRGQTAGVCALWHLLISPCGPAPALPIRLLCRGAANSCN
jgi:hypothetical protein